MPCLGEILREIEKNVYLLKRVKKSWKGILKLVIMVELQKNFCFMSVILKNKVLHCTQKRNNVFEAQDDL